MDYLPEETAANGCHKRLRTIAIRICRKQQQEMFADSGAVKHFAVRTNLWNHCSRLRHRLAIADGTGSSQGPPVSTSPERLSSPSIPADGRIRDAANIVRRQFQRAATP